MSESFARKIPVVSQTTCSSSSSSSLSPCLQDNGGAVDCFLRRYRVCGSDVIFDEPRTKRAPINHLNRAQRGSLRHSIGPTKKVVACPKGCAGLTQSPHVSTSSAALCSHRNVSNTTPTPLGLPIELKSKRSSPGRHRATYASNAPITENRLQLQCLRLLSIWGLTRTCKYRIVT